MSGRKVRSRERPARRSVDLRFAGAAILGSGLVAVVVLDVVAHLQVDVALSAAAAWITVVLLGLALRNLEVIVATGRAAVLAPVQRIPVAISAWLALAAFVVGLLIGRLFWH